MARLTSGGGLSAGRHLATRSAEPLEPAAIGFSSHSGWAATVCLAVPGGTAVVTSRSRLVVTSGPLPCEPYHDAKRRQDEAEKIITAAADEARQLAFEAITSIAASLRADGYELVATGVVLGGARPGRTLAQSLSTHAAMHGAEGWLFREALLEAGQRCDLVSLGVHESELAARAAAALGRTEGGMSELLRDLGAQFGPPWGQDQKTAAMAALVALSSVVDGLP